MNLSRDGGFWGPWLRKVFIPEIEWMQRTFIEFMLPSIPDAATEGEQARDQAWERLMSLPYDESVDLADCAEQAEDIGIDVYCGIANVRQGALNMAVVMLWHLLEQQFLQFHMRQVLEPDEEYVVRIDTKQRNKLFKMDVFLERLAKSAFSIQDCPSWPRVDELWTLANAIKHGRGKSLDILYSIRPDLFTRPGSHGLGWDNDPTKTFDERPPGGEGIYVRDTDIIAYFAAAIAIWQEFSERIEKHVFAR